MKFSKHIFLVVFLNSMFFSFASASETPFDKAVQDSGLGGAGFGLFANTCLLTAPKFKKLDLIFSNFGFEKKSEGKYSHPNFKNVDIEFSFFKNRKAKATCAVIFPVQKGDNVIRAFESTMKLKHKKFDHAKNSKRDKLYTLGVFGENNTVIVYHLFYGIKSGDFRDRIVLRASHLSR